MVPKIRKSPANGKLAMKPVVVLNKINEQGPRKTTPIKVPKTLTEGDDKENVDPEQTPPRVRKEKSRKPKGPTITSIVVIPPARTTPEGITAEQEKSIQKTQGNELQTTEEFVQQQQIQKEQIITQENIPEVAANVDINNGSSDEHQGGENETSNGEIAEQLRIITQQEKISSPEHQGTKAPITPEELERILKQIEEIKEGPNGQGRQAGPSPTQETGQEKVSDE